METLAFILSTIGSVCVCIPPIIKGKNMKLILLFVFFSNAFVAASYALTGAFNGAATCGFGALITIINHFFERKEKPIPKWLVAIYAICFTVINLIVFKKITDIIILVAALIFIAGICVKNGKKYRWWALINTLLWIIYDFITLSFGPLTTHFIQLSTILLGMLLHDRKKGNK